MPSTCTGIAGPALLDRLAALVEQRADATRVHAADEVVADVQRAVLDEHRRDRTLARIELRFDDRAGGAPVRDSP